MNDAATPRSRHVLAILSRGTAPRALHHATVSQLPTQGKCSEVRDDARREFSGLNLHGVHLGATHEQRSQWMVGRRIRCRRLPALASLSTCQRRPALVLLGQY
jgi:hypothetical protein